jgi:DNA repair exonuclease SbcCD ATPase subunit
MKYKWIELYGYAGIYNGMGLMHIRIDFTKCRTNKIIIRGSNGSGKSTIMSAIHPNPDGNEKFIKDTEARKNMCLIANDGTEYVIRYIHPVTNSGRGTTKGYISKMINGTLVELNPNGNISSCKDILYDEFLLDGNFIGLSRLSSEDRGLVDNKPAERKKLINSIISSIDTYNSIYKTLSKKASGLKQLIDTITYKIDSLGEEVKLNAMLQNIDNRLEKFEDEKNKTIEAIAAVKLKISEYMDILRDNNYDSIVSELKEISAHNKSTLNYIVSKAQSFGIDDISKLDEFLIYIEKQIAVLESTIDQSKKQVLVLLSQRESDFKDLQKKQSRLDSLQSEYNYIDIKKATEDAKAIIEEYNEVFRTIGIMNINMISKEEFDIAMESLKILRDSANALYSQYDIYAIKDVIDNLSIGRSYIEDLKNKEEMLYTFRTNKSTIDKDIAVYESKNSVLSDLDKRPKGCTIDDCPYIKTALGISREYPDSKVKELYQKQAEYEQSISEYEICISNLKIKIEIFAAVMAMQRELDSKIKYITKLPVDRNFREIFLQRVSSGDSFRDIDELYKFIDCGNMIEEYKLAQDQLRQYESEYKIYEAKNEIIESVIRDVESLTEKTDNLAKQIETINSDISSNESKLVELSSTKTRVETLVVKLKEDLEPSQSRESELCKIKASLDINSSEIAKLQSSLEQLITNQSTLNNDIKILTDEKDNVKHSLMLLAQYTVELKQYAENYNKIQKIRYYSSPSTGIQTLFMSMYMNKIISVANDLLSLLFSGEFVLQPFIINENEFRIPCLGSGLLHDDISSMSTAQKCMISMILSFAILHQSSTKYNVIMLDEIDGGLDTNNRGYFIELLDKLMYMLQAEQCFIISHNNELNTAACDLIVLKHDSNEIYQGNIIWQY